MSARRWRRSWPTRASRPQDAVELVEVEYEQLPSVTEIEDALKPDAPQVWKGAPGNGVGFNRFGDAAKADAAFKQPPPTSCRSTSCTSG